MRPPRTAWYRTLDEAARLEQPRDAFGAWIVPNRRGNVAIRVGVAVKNPAEHAARHSQIRQVDAAHDRVGRPVEVERQRLAAVVQHAMDLVDGRAQDRERCAVRIRPSRRRTIRPGNGSASMSPTRNRGARSAVRRRRAFVARSSIMRRVTSRPTTFHPREPPAGTRCHRSRSPDPVRVRRDARRGPPRDRRAGASTADPARTTARR